MSKFLSPSFEDNQGSTFAFAYGSYDWPLGSLAHSPRPWSRGRATSGRWGRCRSWGTCRRGWASRALLEAKREAILKLGFMMLGWGVSYKYKIYTNGVNKNIMHIYIPGKSNLLCPNLVKSFRCPGDNCNRSRIRRTCHVHRCRQPQCLKSHEDSSSWLLHQLKCESFMGGYQANTLVFEKLII